MEKSGPVKKAKQKRNRIITACYDCRERKAGCDRKKPICTRCQDGRTCIYLEPPLKALINGKSCTVASLPADIREKVSRLYSQCQGQGDNRDEGEGSDYEGLEASPLVTDSASYDDDADGDDTGVTDLGFRVGKLQLTDRVGGQYRPGMGRELNKLLHLCGNQPEWIEERSTWPAPAGMLNPGIITPNESFLKPSASYLAPNLSLVTSRDQMPIAEYLPRIDVCERILRRYWHAVHPIARIVHRPSFEQRWQTFKSDLRRQNRPTKSLQAIVFAVLFVGLASLPPGTLDREMSQDQSALMRRLQAGTEYALEQAQMTQTTKVETLQAFVAYLMILCRAEVSRVHSALVAAAIRVAECNGLHCDGTERGYNPIETHVRRLIWYNLSFLDIRTSEAQGPRPIIRANDFTTKIPDNVNDSQITKTEHPQSGEGEWTDMTVTIIRFRCNEFIRWIWSARRQLLAKEISVTSVINSIESFRLEWSLKFTPSNPEDPLQRYGVCMLDLQTLRTYAMVLHPYHMHPKLRMPDRLLSILIDNGIKTMDKVIEIESSEAFAPWRWYSGALQQHHYALLMAVEILMNPRRKESPRIWNGLQYVFEPPQLPPIAKARWVISQASWKMETYLGKRQLRAPPDIEQQLAESLKIGDPGLQDQRESSASSEGTAQDEKIQKAGTQRQSTQGKQSRTLKKPPRPSTSKVVISTPSPQSSNAGSIGEGRSPNSTSRLASEMGGSSALGIGAAASKQVVDVDWAVLNDYFPPDAYNGDLDVPFETWTQTLQSTPYAATSEQNVVPLHASNQFSYNFNPTGTSFDTQNTPMGNIPIDDWTGIGSNPNAAHASNFATNFQTFPIPQTPLNLPQSALNSAWPATQDSNTLDMHHQQPQHRQQQQQQSTQWNPACSLPNAVQSEAIQPPEFQQQRLPIDNSTMPHIHNGLAWRPEQHLQQQRRFDHINTNAHTTNDPYSQPQPQEQPNFGMGMYQPITRNTTG